MVCLLLAWSLLSGITRADILKDKDGDHYGKFLAISAQDVEFAPGCKEGERSTIPLASLRSIVFDDECEPPGRSFTSSPITLPCNGREEILFTLAFKTGEIAWARAIATTTSDAVLVVPFETKTRLVGPVADLGSISYGNQCLERLHPSKWPDSFSEATKKQKTGRK